jgi:DNA uptake protein ComE-like DNA-binding protein
MRLFGFAFALILLSMPFLSACTGCSRQEKSPEQIRQDTANATAKLKRDTVAVAQGLKEGLSSKQMVDVNAASKSDLTSLPGITDAQAERIISARPYDNKDQLVTRRVLRQEQYDKIASRITVGK